LKKIGTLPLLVEIGCEEIPARFLTGAQADFGRAVMDGLERTFFGKTPDPEVDPQQLAYTSERFTVHSFSTPRRLVAYSPAVPQHQADQVEEIIGPPVKVAFDEAGKPTRAAESFAAKNEVDVAALVKMTTPKGEYLGLKKSTPGKPAIDLLPGILTDAISALSFPKSMYWLAKSGPRFVRPIRWLLALLGEGKEARVVPWEYAGVKSGKHTYGNRVAGNEAISVHGFDDYGKKLRLAQVELMPGQRRDWMMYDLKELLEASSLSAVEDKWLEDWLVNSTEWPKPLLGSFDEQFLGLPREVLVTVMKDHQKYFAVEDQEGKLHASFVTVLNRTDDPKGLIRSGHERVLRARFADAQFFWDSDQKVPLADRTENLAAVTYQAELGSYADKVERMRQITRDVVQTLADADKILHAEAAHALRAVELCKCDLTTQMVREFTELQGVVGGLYASAQGEPEEVAAAIYDHYKPEGLEDETPRSLIGALVSLADKLDSVVGGFAAGHEPTGSSDPFALRRQANGAVKVLVEYSLPISLRPLVELVMNNLRLEWRRPQPEVFRAVLDFFADRLKFYLESGRNLRYDTVRAALAAGSDVPLEAARRAEALEEMRGSQDFEALCAAAKRIKNILAKSATASDWEPGEVEESLLEAGPERELAEAYAGVAGKIRHWTEAGEYRTALEAIAALRPGVDRFFDKVLVMAEDHTVRQNRLRLLGKLDELFSRIALFAEIAPAPADVDASTSQLQ
jgi:glycyl-tRNA synthetase beta chain